MNQSILVFYRAKYCRMTCTRCNKCAETIFTSSSPILVPPVLKFGSTPNQIWRHPFHCGASEPHFWRRLHSNLALPLLILAPSPPKIAPPPPISAQFIVMGPRRPIGMKECDPLTNRNVGSILGTFLVVWPRRPIGMEDPYTRIHC